MKKYTKKLSALLLTCIMVLSFSTAAFATTTINGGETMKAGESYRIAAAATVANDGKYVPNKIIVSCKGTVVINVDFSTSESYDAFVLYKDAAMKNSIGSFETNGTVTGKKNIIRASVTKGTYYFVDCNFGGYVVKWTFIPAKTAVSNVRNSAKKAMTVKWNKVSYVSGYQIRYSTKSSFSSCKTATVSNASTVSKTIKNLNKGKTYYVKVRTYRVINGHKYYSSWSAKKKVKISK